MEIEGLGRPDIYRELAVRHNEPIIGAFGVVARLIGYAEDDMDCYLILHDPHRGIHWATAVGGYTYLTMLKGQGCIRSTSGEDWNDLWRLDQDLSRAGVPRTDEFQVISKKKRNPRNERRHDLQI